MNRFWTIFKTAIVLALMGGIGFCIFKVVKPNLSVSAEEVKYTIEFLDSENVEIETQILSVGAVPIAPEVVVSEGYVFLDWDKKITAVTGNAVYKAVLGKLKTIEAILPNNIDISETGMFFNFEMKELPQNDTFVRFQICVTDDKYIQVDYSESFDNSDIKFKNINGWLSNFKFQLTPSDKVTFEYVKPYFKVYLNGEKLSSTSVGDLNFTKIKYVAGLDLKCDFTYVEPTLSLIETHEIIFKDFDGEVLSSENVKHNVKPVEPVPVRAGYKFLGWDKNVNVAVGDVEYTAIYELLKGSVIFFYRDENNEYVRLSWQRNLEYFTMPEIPTAPVRAGYVFLGWGRNGVVWNDLSVRFDSIDLQAIYELEKVLITFKDFDGTFLKGENLEIGQMPVGPTPIRKGYTFLGWDKILSEVSESTEYTAVYDKNKYVIQFKNGEEIVSTQNVEFGELPQVPESPIKEGYTFLGWGNVNIVEENCEYQAIFKINIYEVSFVFENIEGEQLIEKQLIEHGKIVVAPKAPIREKLVFLSWNKEIVNASQNEKYVAVYEKIKYEYLFKNFDGTKLAQYFVPIDTEFPANLIPEVPEREGYTFISWNTEVLTISAESKVYTAVYEKKIYTIEFGYYDCENVWQSLGITTYEHADSVTIPSSIEREGYNFVSWNKKILPATENFSYIGSYLEKQIMKVYDKNFDDESSHYYEMIGYWQTPSVPTPEREGYTFVRWQFDTQHISNDVMYYSSVWAKKIYTITFEDGFENILKEINLEYGFNLTDVSLWQGVIPVVIPPKGYDFTGWAPGLDVVQAPKTYVAEYAKKKYQISFSMGDLATIIQEVTFGEMPVLPEIIPVKAGHTFTAFDKELSSAEENVTYIALFTKNDIKYTFKDFYGNDIAEKKSIYGTEPDAPALPIFEHGSFLGWSTAKGGAIQDITFYAKDTIFYANYFLNEYEVKLSFDCFENSFVNSHNYKFNTEVVLSSDFLINEHSGHTKISSFVINDINYNVGSVILINGNVNIYAVLEFEYLNFNIVDNVNHEIVFSEKFPKGLNFSYFGEKYFLDSRYDSTASLMPEINDYKFLYFGYKEQSSPVGKYNELPYYLMDIPEDLDIEIFILYYHPKENNVTLFAVYEHNPVNVKIIIENEVVYEYSYPYKDADFQRKMTNNLAIQKDFFNNEILEHKGEKIVVNFLNYEKLNEPLIEDIEFVAILKYRVWLDYFKLDRIFFDDELYYDMVVNKKVSEYFYSGEKINLELFDKSLYDGDFWTSVPGFEFLGWTENLDNFSVSEPITIKANYKFPKVEIKYFDSSGYYVYSDYIDFIFMPVPEMKGDAWDCFFEGIRDLLLLRFSDLIETINAYHESNLIRNSLKNKYWENYKIYTLIITPNVDVNIAMGLLKGFSVDIIGSDTWKYLKGTWDANDYVLFMDLTYVYSSSVSYTLPVKFGTAVDRVLFGFLNGVNKVFDFLKNNWWIILIVFIAIVFIPVFASWLKRR